MEETQGLSPYRLDDLGWLQFERLCGSCGTYGVLLALSQQGGVAGERSLPLLISDRDWDALGDRIAALLRELEDQDVARVLFALCPRRHPSVVAETGASAPRVPRGGLVCRECGAWATRRAAAGYSHLDRASSLALTARTGSGPEGPPGRRRLGLALAQVLSSRDRELPRRVGFYEHDQQLLAHLTVELGAIADPELRALAESMLRRIRSLTPMYRDLVGTTLTRLQDKPADQRWWIPHDIDAPPSTEPVTHERVGFTREDVSRVLADL